KFTIADFPNLTTLNLGNNSLEEVEIKNCPKLEEIIVSHNKLKDLKIENCPKTAELYASHNQLTSLNFDIKVGNGNSFVDGLRKLQVLSYSDNKLSKEEENKLDGL
ncbi:35822_t:CDS:1, partial [Racocetra persica]